MTEPIKVEGVDYSPEGVEAIRQECIGWRDESYHQWPDAIPFTVGISHVIALLEHLKELKENGRDRWAGR